VNQARDFATWYLDLAEQVNLDITISHIARASVLPEAKLGAYDCAIGRIESVIEQYRAAQVTGIVLGIAYETRARVAMYMNDGETFLRYAKRCAARYKVGENPALTAKYEKLMRDARQAKLDVVNTLAQSIDLSELGGDTVIQLIENAMAECKDRQTRAQRALELLVRQSNCSGGYLYTMQKEGPSLSARMGEDASLIWMEARVRERLAAEIEGTEEMTVANVASVMATCDAQITDWIDKPGEQYRPVVMGYRTSGGFAVAGLAVLLIDPQKPYRITPMTIATISRLLCEAGDVSVVYSAY
jgi:hypothetical protein